MIGAAACDSISLLRLLDNDWHTLSVTQYLAGPLDALEPCKGHTTVQISDRSSQGHNSVGMEAWMVTDLQNSRRWHPIDVRLPQRTFTGKHEALRKVHVLRNMIHLSSTHSSCLSFSVLAACTALIPSSLACNSFLKLTHQVRL